MGIFFFGARPDARHQEATSVNADSTKAESLQWDAEAFMSASVCSAAWSLFTLPK